MYTSTNTGWFDPVSIFYYEKRHSRAQHHLRTASGNAQKCLTFPVYRTVAVRWRTLRSRKKTYVFLDPRWDGRVKRSYVIRTVSSEPQRLTLIFTGVGVLEGHKLEWKLRPSILTHSFYLILSVRTSCRFRLIFRLSPPAGTSCLLLSSPCSALTFFLSVSSSSFRIRTRQLKIPFIRVVVVFFF